MLCRNCAYLRKCIEKAAREGYEHNIDFDASSGCPHFGFKSNTKDNAVKVVEIDQVVKTNADRIRAMSDEELCDFLYSYKFFEMCKEGCGECSYQGDCVRRLMEWLKQPAEGE